MSAQESLSAGRMVTTDIAAELLGVSRVTLERWRFEGRGPRPYRFGVQGRIVRYDRSEVQRFRRDRADAA